MSDYSRDLRDLLGQELIEDLEMAGVDPEYVYHVWHQNDIPASKFRERVQSKLHGLEPFHELEANLQEQLKTVRQLKKGVLRDAVVDDMDIPSLDDLEEVDADEK